MTDKKEKTATEVEDVEYEEYINKNYPAITYDKLMKLAIRLNETIYKDIEKIEKTKELYNLAIDMFKARRDSYWIDEHVHYNERYIKAYEKYEILYDSAFCHPKDVLRHMLHEYTVKAKATDEYKKYIIDYDLDSDDMIREKITKSNMIINEAQENARFQYASLSTSEYVELCGYKDMMEIVNKKEHLKDDLDNIGEFIKDYDKFIDLLPAEKNKYVRLYNTYACDDNEAYLTEFDEDVLPLDTITYKGHKYNVYKYKVNEQCEYVEDIRRTKEHRRYRNVWVEMICDLPEAMDTITYKGHKCNVYKYKVNENCIYVSNIRETKEHKRYQNVWVEKIEE